MAAITLQRLKQVIGIAYEAGYHGCLDLKETYAEEIIQQLLANPADPVLSKNDGWRVYKVKELRVLPPGTMLEHVIRGNGYIEKMGSITHMRWTDGSMSVFVSDEDPWTDPMRLLGRTMKLEREQQMPRSSRRRYHNL